MPLYITMLYASGCNHGYSVVIISPASLWSSVLIKVFRNFSLRTSPPGLAFYPKLEWTLKSMTSVLRREGLRAQRK